MSDAAVPCPARVLRVGLTGNIAAGKSLVGGWLREAGCLVLDTDEAARRCVEPGTPGYRDVVDAFGDEILDDVGHIDRAALGRLVFADPGARRRLEELLHPRILRRVDERIEQWADTVDAGIAVVEAALLFEADATGRFHRIVTVVAPDPIRLARLREEGVDEARARARMEAQTSQEEKAARSDYVVDNGADRRTTRRRVEELVERLRTDLEHLRRGDPLPDPEPPSEKREGG